MACVDVGDANPDIGGIGILLAFGFQALISLILSAWSEFLYVRLNEALTSVWNSPETLVLLRRANPSDMRALKLNSYIFLKLEIIHDVLMLNSDAQTMIGIALSLTGIIQTKSMTLYQYRLLYDTINFTGVSNCAAISCALKKKSKQRVVRLLLIGLFAILYLAFSIRFGIALKGWDDSLPGHCYDSARIALPDASHPYVDNIYLSITCFYLFVMLSVVGSDRRDMRTVLLTEMVQFILHLYFVIAIRVTNEPHLTDGYTENEWSFGQIFAMVMVAGTLLECVKGLLRYRKEREEFDKARKAVSRKQSGLDVERVPTISEGTGMDRTTSHDTTHEGIELRTSLPRPEEATITMRANDEEPRDLEAARAEANEGNRT